MYLKVPTSFFNQDSILLGNKGRKNSMTVISNFHNCKSTTETFTIFSCTKEIGDINRQKQQPKKPPQQQELQVDKILP